MNNGREARELEIPTDFEREFSELFDDEAPDIKLYRMKKVGTKFKGFFLKTYEAYVPTHEDIGNQFGGGHFKLYTVKPNGEPWTRNIYLDEVWNKKDSNGGITKEDLQELFAGAQPKTPDYTTVFKEVAEVFKTIQQAPAAPAAPPPSSVIDSVVEAFSNGLKRMGELMIKNQINQAREPEQIQAPAADPPQEGALAYIHQIKEVITIAKEMGEQFLKSRGMTEKVMKEAIMKSNIMKEAQGNQELASAIFTAGCQDPDIGPDVTKKLFQKLGFQIDETPQSEAA